jgi:hypothetical protein
MGAPLADAETITSDPSFDVASRDPLGLDACLAELPAINRTGDVTRLVTIAREHVRTASFAHDADIRDALAAVRDLGMLAASLRRHGLEPRESVPSIEPLLLALGQRTQMVPRDTVFHYGPWNPRGARERTFTGDARERALIESTRMASPSLERAITALRAMLVTSPRSEQYVALADASVRELQGLAEAIAFARKHVEPAFFAQELRQYFEPIRLGASEFPGAAAAPLSVGLVDHLLWSSDETEADYRSFQNHGIECNVPQMRRLYTERLGQASLVRLLRASVGDDLAAHERAADALDRVFKQVLAFRGRHIVLARDAYNASIRRYQVGSAGYGVDTLDMILRLTKSSRRKLHAFAWDITPEVTGGAPRTGRDSDA